MKVNIIEHKYLNIYVNSFILETKTHNIFIDSGLNGNGQYFEPFMNGKENILLLTHGHWDHIGLNSYLKGKGAVIYAHKGDLKYITDINWHWENLFGQYKNDFALPPERETVFFESVGTPVKTDNCFSKNINIKIDGLDFKIIHTPGHSNGSVCILEKNSGSLFTGDSLIGEGFFNGMPQYTDSDNYINSMMELANLNVNTVYSCHNAPLSGEKLSEKTQKGIETCQKIGIYVEEFIGFNKGVPIELGNAVKYVCEKMGKKAGGGACVTVLGHLNKLRKNYSGLDKIFETHNL